MPVKISLLRTLQNKQHRIVVNIIQFMVSKQNEVDARQSCIFIL
jgi:hypothetical protein